MCVCVCVCICVCVCVDACGCVDACLCACACVCACVHVTPRAVDEGTGLERAKLGEAIKMIRGKSDTPNEDVDIFAFDRNSELFKAAPGLIESVKDTAKELFGSAYVDA